MNRTVFRQIPNGSRLLAVGNFFRASTQAAEWRLAALFERNGRLQLQRFAQEMSCVLAVGREFLGEEGAPYRPSGFKKTVVLPAIDTWRERPLAGEARQGQPAVPGDPEVRRHRPAPGRHQQPRDGPGVRAPDPQVRRVGQRHRRGVLQRLSRLTGCLTVLDGVMAVGPCMRGKHDNAE